MLEPPRAPRQVHVPLRQLPFLAASSSVSSCRSPPECTRQAKRVTQGAGWHTHHARRYNYTLTASAAAAAFADALSACAFNCVGTTVVSCLIHKTIVALLDNAWHTLYLCSQ